MDLLRNIEIDLDEIVENLLMEYSRLEIRESEYQLALQNYERSKDEYSRGMISDINFLTVELGRLYEEKNVYQARKDYIIRIIDFLGKLGEDPVLDILTLPEEKDLDELREMN